MDKLSIKEERKIGFFDKYLTLWVLLCIIVGIAVGLPLHGSFSSWSSNGGFLQDWPTSI